MTKREKGKKLKTAYELALERSEKGRADAEKELTPQQKEEMAKIQKLYDSKLAEKKIVLADQIKQAARQGDQETVSKLEEELAKEIAQLREKMEQEKQKARSSG